MTATRIWSGIRTNDPPFERSSYPELLEMAETLLASRERRFPAMIGAGQIAADQAERDLAIFRVIVADWRWIVTGEGEPASEDTLQDRRAALDASIATIADIARDQGGFSEMLTDQAHRVIALRWHLEPGSQTHFCASVTHELRRRRALQGERR
ncbi:hypothetical protein MZO42_06080 [Sphingomonas psychrotolerans]|uniref:DUF4254 domain-containing protein n=1 Tax=Sphingomonas psychrotolerans TaxID=1327635 RepID=A0ABU3N134_9SPHN|nr:hypothetical protein [Sphingomonas psychrotolerans]MDT8758260.1 hypothetical protein [Sphingomonas psychrotolerans]